MASVHPQCMTCPLGVASLPGDCPFHEKVLRPGTHLVSQGEPMEHAWYVRAGFVMVETIDTEGESVQSALRGPGSLLGLETLQGTLAPYAIWTLTDVTLCQVDKADFARWLGPKETPAGTVLQLAMDEIRSQHEERAAISSGAVQRVARFLLTWHLAAAPELLRTVPRNVLARVLDLRPETFSRALHRLRDVGALAANHELVITDEAALRAAAGGEAEAREV